MHHGHSYLFTAGLFFALFYGLLLVVAYVPGLVRDTLTARRRRKRGLGARSLRVSGSASHTTAKTQTRWGTSTGSKASMSQSRTLGWVVPTHGRATSREQSRISLPTRYGSETAPRRGAFTTAVSCGHGCELPAGHDGPHEATFAFLPASPDWTGSPEQEAEWARHVAAGTAVRIITEPATAGDSQNGRGQSA